jgi:hypothetical protein
MSTPIIYKCLFNGIEKKRNYKSIKHIKREKKVKNKLNEKNMIIMVLKNNEIFKMDIIYVDKYGNNYIFITKDESGNLYIYKTNENIDIIYKKIYYNNEINNDKYWHDFNFLINNSNLFFYYNYKIFKLDLNTFNILTSQKYKIYKSLFSIHKKNNCIYIGSYDDGVYVFNIKTLNLIKKIYLCDKNGDKLQEVTLWCVVKNDKLYVNSQIDCVGGYSQIFKIDGIDKKQIPKYYDKNNYSDFIDGKFLIYKDYIYSTVIYDTKNETFINNNICIDNFYIQNNYLISNCFKYYKKIQIYDLCEDPLLNIIKYEINLENLIGDKNISLFNFNIIMKEKNLFITNNVDKIFLKCKLE